MNAPIPPEHPSEPTDYRGQRRKNDRALLILVVVVLVVFGTGLIGLIFGLPSVRAAQRRFRNSWCRRVSHQIACAP